MPSIRQWALTGCLATLIATAHAQPLKIEAPLPSLPQLVALALTYDSGLQSQRLDSQSMAQEVPMAQAGLRPRLDATAAYRYTDADNIYTDNPDDYPDEVYDDRVSGRTRDTSWELRLTQPLFSLERWRRVGKARAQMDAAALQVAVAERDLAVKVVETYLDAYQASRKLGLLIAQRESLVLQQRQAQRAYDLGIGDRINLLESQSRLDQAVADQTSAENDLTNALSDLERLTGVALPFDPVLVDTPENLNISPESRPLESWLALSRNNVQVRLAAERQRVADRDTDVRRASRYPELNLVVGYSDVDSSDALRTSNDLSASVEMNLPIYQGGYTTASIRQGELTARASAASTENERRLAQQEVRKRLLSMQGDLRQLEALQRSVESGSLFLQAAIRGESLGLRDLVDVLDARSSLYDLRIRFIETLCLYLEDRTYLQATTDQLDTSTLAEVASILERVERAAPSDDV
ncbi:TolC family protein [Salinicola sp. LHM]|uniref:TolC family protein n=1 Tax=unclassified Salinicola TaxID=2634022 RepID=UPI0008DE1664|nr:MULTISPECIES: TolC family protein [unclassified Salinicola]OHZ03828.1 type I secretion protein TolC [Salinicola sp. MIT1003]WQH34688.1 TolC family protein [Salinicola sp. LHM]